MVARVARRRSESGGRPVGTWTPLFALEGGWAGDTCEEAHDARGLSLPSQGDNDLVPTA